ncbi:putative toxin-antitoxin system toxin component, PIN family, partial [Salmonella enterica subsp. enterica serovar Enteritidis]|nr:putative toxin-antitoxin system toxin component, PIN family [Salmonella enterica subsp. enterica serovar Enteritidis]
MRLVLDTNVILSARRSFEGASNALLRAVGERRITMLASVPLFMEYEAVLNRPEQLLAMKMAPEQVSAFLDALAGMIQPVKLHYLWRPQLSDVADEMVLETAINGRADAVVTFNTRHFGP